uniref:Uncharacterized protein n=1 Tax=Rhizophora mucronata TaxID=61149 RepID=A0A2P2L9W9_RHIMU
MESFDYACGCISKIRTFTESFPRKTGMHSNKNKNIR